MKRFLLTLCALCAATLAWADTWTDPETGIIWHYGYSATEGSTITKVENAVGDIEIPDILGPKVVVAISQSVFAYNEDITGIILPIHIKTIWDSAFRGCSNLKKIRTNSYLEKIYMNAFYDCVSLEAFEFPESLTLIGACSFKNCEKLTTVKFSDKMNLETELTIGDEAFENTNITNLQLPNNLSVIGSRAFFGCEFESVVIPASVTSIGEDAFGSIKKLIFYPKNGSVSLPVDEYGPRWINSYMNIETLIISESWDIFSGYANAGYFLLSGFGFCDGVTTISSEDLAPFRGALGNLKTVYLPNTLTYMDDQTAMDLFYQGWDGGVETIVTSKINESIQLPDSLKDSLKYIVVPEGTTFLESSAFSVPSFDKTVTVTLPESLTRIKSRAFSYLKVKELRLPKNVQFLDAGWLNADYDYLVTEVLSVDEGNPYFCAENNIIYDKEKTKLITAAPCAPWGTLVVPEGVTTIEPYALNFCPTLTRVVLPESLEKIDFCGFHYCSKLTDLHLPKATTDVDFGGLSTCESLETITVDPENEAYFAEKNIVYSKDGKNLLFLATKGVKGSVSLSESLVALKDNLFGECTGLTHLQIPAATVDIDFSKWTIGKYLEEIVIDPENPNFYSENNIVYTKDKSAILFVANKGIENYTGAFSIPEGPTAIANNIFSSARKLTSISIPASVTEIADLAFSGCSQLKTLTFAGDVPKGFSLEGLQGVEINYPNEYADSWERFFAAEEALKTEGFLTVTVAAEMIEQKKMKVTYTIESDLEEAYVRAVAFKDGIRSFNNIVPVKSGTNVPGGERVKTNTPHTFIWDIASDWTIDLATVSVDVMATSGMILPVDCIVIPPVRTTQETAFYKPIRYLPKLPAPTLLTALFWCYAEGDEQLKLQDGKVYVDDLLIAEGASIPSGTRWDSNISNLEWCSANLRMLYDYLYRKCGYTVFMRRNPYDDGTLVVMKEILGLDYSVASKHNYEVLFFLDKLPAGE